MRVKDRGEVVAEIPNTALVDEAPVYDRPTSRPAYLDTVNELDLGALTAGRRRGAARVLSSPTIASKRWVYRQYDHMVRTNTLVLAGMGAGVVRIKGTPRALAMSTDGNGRHCYLDPRKGAMLAVAEAARNVACAGARADRRHQLPQLRQSREARDHVAVRRGRRRDCRGLPRARCADHRRQRQPLQRDRRQRDLSDAHHRRGRRHRRCVLHARPRVPQQRREIVLLGEADGDSAAASI